MADTAKTSPENISPVPKKTYGVLYSEIQQQGVLTKEESEYLQQQMEKKYGKSGLLRKRDEIITNTVEARRELAETLGSNPRAQQILSKLDSLLPGKENIPIVAQNGAQAAKELAEKGGKAVGEMVPKAMVQGMEKAGKELKEEAGKAGTQVVSAMGDIVSANGIDGLTGGIDKLSKAIDAVSGFVGNAIHQLGELLSGLMAMLGLDKLWKSFSKLLGGDTSESTKPSDAKEKTGDVAADLKKKAEDFVNSPDKIKEQKEKLANQFWKGLTDSGWIKNPALQKDEFMKVFGEYSDEFMKATGQTVSDVKDENAWNWVERFAKYPTLGARFMLALVAKNVIPKEAIAMNIYDTGRASLRMYLLSPYTLISNGASKPLIDMGILDANSLSQFNQVEKQALIGAMHYTMAPQLYLAGQLTSGLARVSLLGLYWDQGTGFTKIKSGIDNIFGELSQSAKHFDELTEMLGNNTAKADLAKYTEEMRSIVTEAKLKATVAYTFREMEHAGKSTQDIAQKLASIGEEFPSLKNKLSSTIAELHTNTSHTNARRLVSEFLVSSAGGLSGLDKVQGAIRNSVKPLSVSQQNLAYFSENAKALLGRYGESLANVVEWKHVPFASLYQKLKLNVTQAEFIDAIEKGHLPVKVADASDAKGVLQQLIKNIPKGFEHLFAGVTIWLTIDHTMDAKEGEKLKTALLDIASINPMIGGIMLMYEGAEMKGGVPQKLGYFVGGGIVTALGVKEVTSLIAEKGVIRGVGQFAISPITTLYRTGTALVRGPQYLYQMARFGATTEGSLGVLGLRNAGLFARARPLGILGAGAILTYFVMSQIFEKETQEIMKKAGFFKENGEIDNDNMKSAYAKLAPGDKPKILEEILSKISGGIVTYRQSDNSLVVHNQPGQTGLPIGMDAFESFFKMFSDLGIPEPKIFMSASTTESVKKAIAELNISEDKKREFYGKFGIPV